MNWYRHLLKTTKSCQKGTVKIRKLGREGKLNIFLVNGEKVRDCYDKNFEDGGHDLHYKFIPDNEVWIEKKQSRSDCAIELSRILYERKLMQNGMSYHNAKKRSQEYEKKSRFGRE